MVAVARRKVFILSLFCILMLVAACSSGDSGTKDTATPAASGEQVDSTATSAGDSTTRMLETVKGNIEVPTNPQRVVVLYMLGDVLAFDVTPAGVSGVYEGAAFEQELADVPKLGEWFEPNREVILELNPDLIIVPSEETYEILKDIAPTVLLNYFDAPLEERIRQVGEALGKESQVSALLEAFYLKVEDGKQRLAEAGLLDKTVTIVEGGKGSMGVAASKDYGRGSQIIYEYLGMKAPDILQQEIDAATGANGMDVSFETLESYIGDIVFRSSYEGMFDLSDHPIWNNIPAVKEGRLIEISFGLSYYNDIFSLDKQLDFIVDRLLLLKE